MKQISLSKLKKHNTENDAWVKIDDKVYDISEFHNNHPGGSKILLKLAGTDVTNQFYSMHSKEILETHGSKLLIGTIKKKKKYKSFKSIMKQMMKPKTNQQEKNQIYRDKLMSNLGGGCFEKMEKI